MEFLKIQVASSVETSVYHVKKGYGYFKRRLKTHFLGQIIYPDIKVHPGSRGSCLGSGHRNSENGIAPILGFILRPVQIVKFLVNRILGGRVHADDRRT